jgi:hypothetical protein
MELIMLLSLTTLQRFGLLLVMLTSVPAMAQDRSSRFDNDILVDTFGYGPGTPSDVPYADIMQGCQARDCIPPIDAPVFVNAEQAEHVRDTDLVLGVVIKGDARAYPQLIMNYHEIVNDTIAGKPVAVTFCPLCGSGVAFERELLGQAVEFGVSGLLHGNDLVMYDRSSNSLWQQITGKAFMGPMRGRELTNVPVAMVEWKTWREAHPDTKVLSTETGHTRDYRNGPYGDYASSDRIMFPLANKNLSMHPKTVVHGFEIDGRSLAVTDKLVAKGTVQTQLGEHHLSLQKTASGLVTATDADSGKSWEGIRLFWFAWFNFHPDTELAN